MPREGRRLLIRSRLRRIRWPALGNRCDGVALGEHRLLAAEIAHLSVNCPCKAVVFRYRVMTQRQDSAMFRCAADLIPAWPAPSLPSQAAPATFPAGFHHCAGGVPG
ncbi:conserved hypothetical protein [Mesorhizobium escarrei]|uniref:Uncharacterized protein n=1 Tax=Mesorhizobium escarrei TaxID=666018 RepID=A0ABM9EIK9_9HYPH|nr:conserved hypothetical protein [Mesorhizobium escarrei]